MSFDSIKSYEDKIPESERTPIGKLCTLGPKCTESKSCEELCELFVLKKSKKKEHKEETT